MEWWLKALLIGSVILVAIVGVAVYQSWYASTVGVVVGHDVTEAHYELTTQCTTYNGNVSCVPIARWVDDKYYLFVDTERGVVSRSVPKYLWDTCEVGMMFERAEGGVTSCQ